jgi:hypothetical protein
MWTEESRGPSPRKDGERDCPGCQKPLSRPEEGGNGNEDTQPSFAYDFGIHTDSIPCVYAKKGS